jgi:energy-coupling factor transporter ATP-binding protein EcfA2
VDFYNINERSLKDEGTIEIYPDFKVARSTDLMIRGRSFYAIWDEPANMWSTNEYDVARLVDADLDRYKAKVIAEREVRVKVKYMGKFSSGVWREFRNYMGLLSDNSHQLDDNLTFANSHVKKTDYVSKRLPYPLEEGPLDAWHEIIGTLYHEDDRAKIEWAIGAILAGDSKYIQKFIVLYGPAGSGKSTILNIILKLFVGYTVTFEAKALTSNNNSFATEVFKSNPLVAIQHDGDLSKIEDNTKLNSITSHEIMTMNEKYKPSYDDWVRAFAFMGTNKPVKITDAKSGIIRRLIDVQPSGNKLPPKKYHALISHIDFELGAIAHYCLGVYREMGKNYYEGYKPVEMMLQTDVFYNFIEQYYDVFRTQDGVGLEQAYKMYLVFCEETNVEYKLARYKFREELKNYFSTFEERKVIDGERVRSWYSDFQVDNFKPTGEEDKPYSLTLDDTTSLLDAEFADLPAQYSKANGSPNLFWDAEPRLIRGKMVTPRPDQVNTSILTEIDTSREHYVKPPLNHIVIDFDLKDEEGKKSAERNLEAASLWPATYTEYSKSGEGIHLHYNYGGDPARLSRLYAEDIEIKVFTGNSSLRRRLSKCNNVPVATLNSGLPLKEKQMISTDVIRSEKGLRSLIERNLRKEIHPNTKSSMDFIDKILKEAYASGVAYDLTDMSSQLMAFASSSSNQALYCLDLFMNLQLKSAESGTIVEANPMADERVAIFDVEVFPNLFVICWGYADDDNVATMINPKPHEVEALFKMRLVGFNNRHYDNHILHAAAMGYSNIELYKLSKKIIEGGRNAQFGEAYDLSYADIFDFSSIKQSLKKFQITLGLPHLELGLDWDTPVPPELVDKVCEYCRSDVSSTKAVWKDRRGDFVARQILADLSGLPINASTPKHTARIIFGTDRNFQDKFIYTRLQEEFPDYTFESGKSLYRGENPSEGGYVYAEPGMYEEVAVLDVASMHPTTMEVLDIFGPYTKNFTALRLARIAIKRGDYDSAKKMLDGKLAKHLGNPEEAEALSYALKIVINIVYGLTSAKFDNPFRDRRNVDNIVAKRGALFMIDLKHAVQEQGFVVAHIKTDSIKIPNATKEIIEFVMEFGEKYGYEFEHEETYDRMCLVNDAVYIAKTKDGRKPAHWSATGAQFQHPYVFKTMFSKEPIVPDDMVENKFVTTSMHVMSIDFSDDQAAMALDQGAMQFIGKAGSFFPMLPGTGGGRLLRYNEKANKYDAVVGTKGYEWMEAALVANLNKFDDIDESYFKKLVDAAHAQIAKYGDPEWFLD